MNQKNIPNLLTILRMFCIVPLVWGLLNEYYMLALTMFVIAGVSDALDGYLARRFKWQTRFGSIADPLADKVLLLSCFISLYYIQALPGWLLTLVLSRDIIIILGGLVYHFLIGEYDLKPTMISKINTVVQLVLLTGILGNLALDVFPSELILSLMGLVMISTIASCADYVSVWGSKAWRTRSKEHGK